MLRRHVDLGLEEGRETELALGRLDEERRRACVGTLARHRRDPGKFKVNADADSAPEADSGE